MILSRLVIEKIRMKSKELYEIENEKNLSDKEKEQIYDYLVKVVKTLNNKEKYQYHDHHDLDYYGIKDIENLFGNADEDNDYYYYCKPILMESSLRIITNIMKAEEGKRKTYQ